MAIETLDDILEELADRIGIYGSEVRVGWITAYEERIKKAVKIERILTQNDNRIPKEESNMI